MPCLQGSARTYASAKTVMYQLSEVQAMKDGRGAVEGVEFTS